MMSAMLTEYSYIWRERNRSTGDAAGEVEGVDFEWVDLPDWDNPGKTKRLKKYKDIGDKISTA